MIFQFTNLSHVYILIQTRLEVAEGIPHVSFIARLPASNLDGAK